MKPRAFDYVRATSLQDVFGVLDSHGDEAKILAGGQSLVPAMNMRLAGPEIVVDVNAVAALRGIVLEGNVLRIGAMTRYVEIAASELVARHAPLVAQAIPFIAHPAIRNRGTLGGSLCNADPASELPAVAVAQRAVLNVSSSSGDRTVAARDFFVSTYMTALEPNEILVSVDIPVAGAGSRAFFDEIVRRRGDYALSGLAACAERRDGRLGGVQLVFFAVSDTPVVATSAMALVEGRVAGALDEDAVCHALERDVTPLADLTTSSGAKLHLMKVLTRRALAAFAAEET